VSGARFNNLAILLIKLADEIDFDDAVSEFAAQKVQKFFVSYENVL